MNETLFWSKLAKRCADLGHQGCKDACDPKKAVGRSGHDDGNAIVSFPYWDTEEEFLDRCVSGLGMKWKEFAAKAPMEFAPYKEWKRYYVYKQIDPKTGNITSLVDKRDKREYFGPGHIGNELQCYHDKHPDL